MLTSTSNATSNQLCTQSLSFYSRLLLHKQHLSCASVRLARITFRCSEAFSKNHDVCACLLLLKRGPRGTRGRANGRQKAGLWSPAAGDIQPWTKIIIKENTNKWIQDRKRVSTVLISPAHFNQAKWCLIYVLDYSVSKQWTWNPSVICCILVLKKKEKKRRGTVVQMSADGFERWGGEYEGKRWEGNQCNESVRAQTERQRTHLEVRWVKRHRLCATAEGGNWHAVRNTGFLDELDWRG